MAAISRSSTQDRAIVVAGGQDVDNRYEVKEEGVSKDTVNAVKSTGNARKTVEAEIGPTEP